MNDAAADPSQPFDFDQGPHRPASLFLTIVVAVFVAGVALLLVLGAVVSHGDRTAKADTAREYRMTTGLVTARGECNATVGAAYRAAHTASTDTEVEAAVNRCLIDLHGYTAKDIPAGQAIAGIRQHCYAVRC